MSHDHQHTPHDHVCRHGPLGQHRDATDAVCLDNVSYSYNATPALQDVTLHVEAGCNLGIIGPNGGGKTTLLKIILGLLPDYTGSVRVMGHEPSEVCRRGDVVGYVPQKHEFEPRFPLDVRQVVRMGLVGKTGLLRRYAADDCDYVDHLMAKLDVAKLADRPIGSLSGGQQQRAFIARALAPRTQILLLDEPTLGIDLAGQRHFADLIHDLHESLKLTIIIVSHDLRAVAGASSKLAVLSRTIHYHDSPGGLTSDLLEEVFRHDVAPTLD
jgi:zinc transport system ATP-binding protein